MKALFHQFFLNIWKFRRLLYTQLCFSTLYIIILRFLNIIDWLFYLKFNCLSLLADSVSPNRAVIQITSEVEEAGFIKVDPRGRLLKSREYNVADFFYVCIFYIHIYTSCKHYVYIYLVHVYRV